VPPSTTKIQTLEFARIAHSSGTEVQSTNTTEALISGLLQEIAELKLQAVPVD